MDNDFNTQILASASDFIGVEPSAAHSRRVQTLWGGMGQILRISRQKEKVTAPPQRESVIVKYVNPPPRALDASAVSDKEFRSMLRKLVSFHVEGNFYEHIAPVIAGYDSLFDDVKDADCDCRLPLCLRVDSKTIPTAAGGAAQNANDGDSYGPHAARHAFFLEDLSQSGFEHGTHPSDENEISDCLAWLAAFHARTMKYLYDECGGAKGQKLPLSFDVAEASVPANGRAAGCGELISINGVDVWRTGTYWHLHTRPDELRSMVACAGNDRTISKLGEKAVAVDAALNAQPSGRGGGLKHQCLLHGDPKLANFCFRSKEAYRKTRRSRISALDFQYVGVGCGMRDVAYFLEGFNGYDSPGPDSTPFDGYLDGYFHALKRNLGILLPQIPNLGEEVENEWRPLYPIAAADLTRFMVGWSGSSLGREERKRLDGILNALP